jgi:hypothetical protein
MGNSRAASQSIQKLIQRRTKRREVKRLRSNSSHSLSGDQRSDGASQESQSGDSSAPRPTQSVMLFPLPPD